MSEQKAASSQVWNPSLPVAEFDGSTDLADAIRAMNAPLRCDRCRQRIADDGWCSCDALRGDDYDD